MKRRAIISGIKSSGSTREFGTGAHRDAADDKLRMSLVPQKELERVMLHYLNGGKTYGFDNWKKGMPLSVYYDSANRHIAAWWAGEDDEDHLAAAIWNMLNAMWTESNCSDEFNDRTEKKDNIVELVEYDTFQSEETIPDLEG